ncbi:MAG: hypothetical protein CL833_06535 [Crocinitomicaceae bacterium]|nr:hypothetical protein [Crocinitomicaceae bacterium]|tara:strand:+ start:2769 stop:2999 length:231 start_codon:yes stop_codon:yes gene_type:complete
MSDEHEYKFELYFKNGKEKHLRVFLEKEQADEISDVIYASLLKTASGVLVLTENKSITHFVGLSEVQNVVVYKIED